MSNTSKHHTIMMLRQARSVLLKNKLSGGLTAGLLQHIKRLDSDIKSDEANDAKYDELMRVGKCAAESICEMVAALQCDYDRLEELRDERQYVFEQADPHHSGTMHEEYTCGCGLSVHPSQYIKTAVHINDCPFKELTDWDSKNSEELAELESAAGECESREDAEQRIQEDALEATVRSDWQSFGETLEPTEFCILLSTGGPASRIVGELRDGSPCRARLEVQDWGTPWTEYREEGLVSALLSYASCFYFGE